MATKCLTTTWKQKASNFAKVNNINENNAIEQLIGIINRPESKNMSDDEIMTTLSDIFNAKVDRTEFTENQNKIFDTLVNREYVNLNVVQKSLNTLQKCTTNIQPFVFKTQEGTYKIGVIDGINNKKPYKNQQKVEELFEDNPELTNSVYSKILTNPNISAKNLLSLLEKENIVEKDCFGGGKLKAEKGLVTSFTKGSQWEIVKDLKGYPSHAQGGVDIKLGKDGFSFARGSRQIMAAHGLVLPKIK